MNIKTLTAASIHAALADARRQFGDGVVLLESVPPEGEAPARVTVMVEDAETSAPPSGQATGRTSQDESGRSEAGYAMAPLLERTPPSAADRSAAASAPSATETASRFAELLEAGRQTPGVTYERSGGAGRGRLFTPPPAVPASPATASANVEKLLEAQVKTIHARLDAMERRFADALVGTSHWWTSHPLFRTLLDEGMRPATLTRLFSNLADAGYEPDADAETLRWALAQEVRRFVDVEVPKRSAGTQLFMGPSGAGKTSLLLKLAKDAGIYGRRQVAVLVVLPEDQESALYHNPVEIYRRFGLPVQSVEDAEGVRAALDRLDGFDQILIDTPPMPLEEAAARKMVAHLQQVVHEMVPLQVQLVVNTTRTLETLGREFIDRLPLRPDVVALTHLDETCGWGRIAEWIVALERPVQFLSASPLVRDGVIAFSPSWFVERMMKL